MRSLRLSVGIWRREVAQGRLDRKVITRLSADRNHIHQPTSYPLTETLSANRNHIHSPTSYLLTETLSDHGYEISAARGGGLAAGSRPEPP